MSGDGFDRSAWHEATAAVSPSITSFRNDLIDVTGYSVHKHLLDFLSKLENTQSCLHNQVFCVFNSLQPARGGG